MNERRWSLCEAGKLREAVIPGCHPMAHERGRSACSSTCAVAYLAYTGKWETCQGIGIRCETTELPQGPLTALSSATPHPRVGPRNCKPGGKGGTRTRDLSAADCAAAPPHAWLRRPPSRAHLARPFRLGVGKRRKCLHCGRRRGARRSGAMVEVRCAALREGGAGRWGCNGSRRLGCRVMSGSY